MIFTCRMHLQKMNKNQISVNIKEEQSMLKIFNIKIPMHHLQNHQMLQNTYLLILVPLLVLEWTKSQELNMSLLTVPVDISLAQHQIVVLQEEEVMGPQEVGISSALDQGHRHLGYLNSDGHTYIRSYSQIFCSLLKLTFKFGKGLYIFCWNLNVFTFYLSNSYLEFEGLHKRFYKILVWTCTRCYQ